MRDTRPTRFTAWGAALALRNRCFGPLGSDGEGLTAYEAVIRARRIFRDLHRLV